MSDSRQVERKHSVNHFLTQNGKIEILCVYLLRNKRRMIDSCVAAVAASYRRHVMAFFAIARAFPAHFYGIRIGLIGSEGSRMTGASAASSCRLSFCSPLSLFFGDCHPYEYSLIVDGRR